MLVSHGKFCVKITSDDKNDKFKVKTYDFINNNFQIRKKSKDFLS